MSAETLEPSADTTNGPFLEFGLTVIVKIILG